MQGLKQTRIILYVRSMAESVRFYRDILGLKVTFPNKDDLAQEFWVTLDSSGTSIALHPGRDTEVDKNGPSVDFMVTDIQSTRQTLIESGAQFEDIVNPHEGVFFCHGKDPDGHSILLSQA